MNTFLKKIILFGMLCMMFTTTVLAEKKEFYFKCINRDTDGYTKNNPKSDYEKYAYVTVTEANLSTSDKVYYVVTNSDKDKEVTRGITYCGTSKPNAQRLAYYKGYGTKNIYYRLKLHTYHYWLTAKGRWNS